MIVAQSLPVEVPERVAVTNTTGGQERTDFTSVVIITFKQTNQSGFFTLHSINHVQDVENRIDDNEPDIAK